jgi:hypothetical protein
MGGEDESYCYESRREVKGEKIGVRKKRGRKEKVESDEE